MVNLNKINKKGKLEKIFSIIYYVSLSLFVISIILFSNLQGIAKNIFSILSFAFFETLILGKYLENFLTTKNFNKRLRAFLCYLVNDLIFIVNLFIKSYDVFIISSFIYNSFLTIYLIIDYVKYKTQFPSGKLFERSLFILPAFILFLALDNVINHNYLIGNKIMLVILIPASLIMILFLVLTFTIFKESLNKLAKSLLSKIGIILLALILCYPYSWALLDTVNTIGKKAPVQKEHIIVEKNIKSGYRQITRYQLYVLIDGKKEIVNVSSDLYNMKQINDTLTLNYYDGLLGLKYYESGE